MSAREAGPRLGRGLAALLGDAAPAAVAEGPRALPLASVEPGPFQPRAAMAPAALDELVESVRRQGVLQPILVRPHPGQPGRFQIVAGERRWRASGRAGLAEIPALVRELSDAQAMAAGLVENLQRTDLDAIEEALGFRRLGEEFGLTPERLGEAVGKSRSHVANVLRLLTLPAPVQAHVRDGTLSAGHARALLAHPDPAAAARQVIEGGLNVRQTEALAQHRAPSAAPRPPPVRHPELEMLERDLAAITGLGVSVVVGRGGAGSLTLRFQDASQLDAVLERLRR